MPKKTTKVAATVLMDKRAVAEVITATERQSRAQNRVQKCMYCEGPLAAALTDQAAQTSDSKLIPRACWRCLVWAAMIISAERKRKLVAATPTADNSPRI